MSRRRDLVIGMAAGAYLAHRVGRALRRGRRALDNLGDNLVDNPNLPIVMASLQGLVDGSRAKQREAAEHPPVKGMRWWQCPNAVCGTVGLCPEAVSRPFCSLCGMQGDLEPVGVPEEPSDGEATAPAPPKRRHRRTRPLQAGAIALGEILTLYLIVLVIVVVGILLHWWG